MTTATEKRTLTMVSGIFRDRKKASSFHHWLTQSGFTSEHIHVLMSEDSRRHYNEDPDSQIKPDNKAVEGVATGGTIGTIIGATLGAVAAIGTSVLVPGLGIAVAGPILAGLVGGGAGAITGGLVGGLIGLGIPESNGAAYEKALKDGGVVVGVTLRDSDDRKEVEKKFKELEADNIVVTTP